MTNPKAELYQELFANSHEWLEGTIADLTPETAAWQPDGKAVPAGAHYAHHVVGEDLFIQQMFQGKQPLMATEYAGKTGLSEPHPMGPWDEWARRVDVDLDATRAYAAAVYAATDRFLAGLTQEELDREIEVAGWDMGPMKLSYLLNQVLTDVAAHCGEISCIKGLQGLKGYPF